VLLEKRKLKVVLPPLLLNPVPPASIVAKKEPRLATAPARQLPVATRVTKWRIGKTTKTVARESLRY
jgi:hypothetical protein